MDDSLLCYYYKYLGRCLYNLLLSRFPCDFSLSFDCNCKHIILSLYRQFLSYATLVDHTEVITRPFVVVQLTPHCQSDDENPGCSSTWWGWWVFQGTYNLAGDLNQPCLLVTSRFVTRASRLMSSTSSDSKRTPHVAIVGAGQVIHVESSRVNPHIDPSHISGLPESQRPLL